ncbi:hypothetical protein [Microvirga sp. 2TAF3]|uniref:hypothetical protein n=1 Tax=Microvirga sp. 2TAF3 TaxID=3233014 RepID=UPI003F986153
MTSRAFLTRWQRAAITVAISYALILQAVLFSLGGALHAQAAGLPQEIICTQGAGADSSRAPAKPHAALCCILSCGVSAPPAGPVPVLAHIAQPVSVQVANGFLAAKPFLRLASAVLPVGSRAPPRLG